MMIAVSGFMCVLVCVAVFAISLVTLQGVMILSKRYRISIDSSRSLKPQRFHHRPTSRAGGVGIVLGVLVGFMFFELISSLSLYFLAACVVIFFSGFLEDIGISLSPKIRLIIQCVGALLVCVAMENAWLKDLGLGFELAYIFGVGFGVFAIVGVCNAMNIIDGFNGLSGGVTACVCASIMVIAHQAGAMEIFWACAVLFCAVLGFLVLNFPKGKIFLGDGGAYFIGFFLAVMLVLLTQTTRVSPWYGFCVMIYPVWEVVFSILRKKLAGKSPMKPDSKHFHMLLFKKLGNNPLTAFIIICANAPFIILATLFAMDTPMLMLICVMFIIAYILTYRLLAR